MIKLGVNIDHVATLRQARGGKTPNIVEAAHAAVRGGADGITIHLREDRRHIQDADVNALVPLFRVNLEMAATREMTEIAERERPHAVCLVPERRQELTTEGGLNVLRGFEGVKACTRKLRDKGVIVSHFIDSDPWQIQAAAQAGANYVEFHTGRYADTTGAKREDELRKLRLGGKTALRLKLRINAGHGLDLSNIMSILDIQGLEELNIGFSIVARAMFIGLEDAVKEMKNEIISTRSNA